MRAELKLTGLGDVLKTLQQLPPEIVSKRGGPVRKALRKGASVIAKQARANLRAAVSNATASGEQESTGLLAKNVVVSRGKAPSSGKGERYLVRIKKRTYQREGTGEAVTTLKTGQILEYGSSKQPAEPWLRPAFASRAEEAIKTIETSLVAEVEKVASKYLKR